MSWDFFGNFEDRWLLRQDWTPHWKEMRMFCNARFTLANPMPRLASDVVGGKSGRNHPTSRRDLIQIGRMARNAYIRGGWYGEGVLFITTLSCVVHVRLPIGRRPPDEAPTADSGSGTHSHWPSRQHRGVGSANVKRTLRVRFLRRNPPRTSIITADLCPSSSYCFQEMVRPYIAMINHFKFVVGSFETIVPSIMFYG